MREKNIIFPNEYSQHVYMIAARVAAQIEANQHKLGSILGNIHTRIVSFSVCVIYFFFPGMIWGEKQPPTNINHTELKVKRKYMYFYYKTQVRNAIMDGIWNFTKKTHKIYVHQLNEA